MILSTLLSGKRYDFQSVTAVLAKANEEKSGDQLAGIAAQNSSERVAAKLVLANLTLNDLFNNPVVAYEDDEVTRNIIDQVDMAVFTKISRWTVAELREWILDLATTSDMLKELSAGLTAEMIAAVTKLMSNLDLIQAAAKITVEKTANTTIGRPGTFSSRLQPNHPTDNPAGIRASMMEGLSMGAGDAVIGVNPVNDTVASVSRVMHTLADFVDEWQIPTQTCVLAHVTTQMQAIEAGAPAGLIFQSIAGSQKANESFGINQALIAEAKALSLTTQQVKGPNVMYFETGQGAEFSANAHFGADQLTMEARCYGFAKQFDPFLVNTVVGFIGPEYLYDGKQVTRAGLEDHFMGKLTGLSMGCDVCYTNHTVADQNDAENLALLLANAGCNFIMGIPHGDDVMLNYQTTGYQETATIRELLGRTPIAEFEAWLEDMHFMQAGHLAATAGDLSQFAALKSGGRHA
ncbi:MAG: ethanolamine ammonia-lyase subunit EutB [Lactobacillaceae bacterium]|jgi:ethanolamine ammonia-lyase large subunit|nr:ethanolamine ammonia-lyase subunit EutB [Lactobacillaceae bacterium]